MASVKQTAFNLLPDELLLKIVKMAAMCKGSQGSVPIKFNHNFLAQVLAKLSVRFRNISLDKIFWRNTNLCGVCSAGPGAHASGASGASARAAPPAGLGGCGRRRLPWGAGCAWKGLPTLD